MLEITPDALRVRVLGEVPNELGLKAFRGEVERLEGDAGPPYEETATPRGLTGIGMLSVSSAVARHLISLTMKVVQRPRRRVVDLECFGSWTCSFAE